MRETKGCPALVQHPLICFWMGFAKTVENNSLIVLLSVGIFVCVVRKADSIL